MGRELELAGKYVSRVRQGPVARSTPIKTMIAAAVATTAAR